MRSGRLVNAAHEPLVDCAHWIDSDLWQAVRLVGYRPEPEHMRDSAPAWYFRFLNHHAHNAPDAEAYLLLLKEDHQPNLAPGEPSIEANNPRPASRWGAATGANSLTEVFDRLTREEAVLQEVDGPDRAEVAERALILQDPVSARLFLRYHSEARNSFHRSYAALLKTLERDAEAPDAPPKANHRTKPRSTQI